MIKSTSDAISAAFLTISTDASVNAAAKLPRYCVGSASLHQRKTTVSKLNKIREGARLSNGPLRGDSTRQLLYDFSTSREAKKFDGAEWFERFVFGAPVTIEKHAATIATNDGDFSLGLVLDLVAKLASIFREPGVPNRRVRQTLATWDINVTLIEEVESVWSRLTPQQRKMLARKLAK